MLGSEYVYSLIAKGTPKHCEHRTCMVSRMEGKIKRSGVGDGEKCARKVGFIPNNSVNNMLIIAVLYFLYDVGNDSYIA